jgi:hypothetical protein
MSIEPFLKSTMVLDRDKFFDPNEFESTKEKLIEGNVVIVRNAVDKELIRQKVKKLLSQRHQRSSDTRVIQGVGNIYYESNGKTTAEQKNNSKDSYQAVDKSFYFFPWNYDASGISKLIQPLFDQVLLLNELNPSEIIKRTPKDGVVQRFHLIFYPEGQGLISTHRDPVKETKFTGGIYVTEYGIDYTEGGFYVINFDGEKIFVDHEVSSGDLVIFLANLPHGVEKNYFRDSQVHQGNNDRFLGRCFLNMTVIESHHIQDRETTKGINIS